ncbi:MAG: hypothetical protein MZV65_28995 [Chromatiales bacterium]|nr:hypothetical protein [Chromatiales bacterium]
MVHDTAFEYQVVMHDSAHNTGVWSRPNYTITVEDNAAPDRTKIVDVVALAYQQDDYDKTQDLNPDVWKDINGNGYFNIGTDWLISEGDDFQPPQQPEVGGPQISSVGDERHLPAERRRGAPSTTPPRGTP